MKTILKYEDSGHGWYAVEKDYLKLLGIDKKISGYSYQRGKIAYLEEDCDGSLLCNELDAREIEYNVQYVRHEESPVRGYAGYSAR